MALVGSGGVGGEAWLGFFLGEKESSPWGLDDDPSPTCLALLDLNLNRFMIITAKTSNHTQKEQKGTNQPTQVMKEIPK